MLLATLGHMELNEVRLLSKLPWKPLIFHVSYLIGFEGPRAKHVIHEGMDRLCSRGILSVCLDTISKELVRFV